MCGFLVFDRKLEFQVKSQILGKNGSFWGGQNLAKTCTQKLKNRQINRKDCQVASFATAFAVPLGG